MKAHAFQYRVWPQKHGFSRPRNVVATIQAEVHAGEAHPAIAASRIRIAELRHRLNPLERLVVHLVTDMQLHSALLIHELPRTPLVPSQRGAAERISAFVDGAVDSGRVPVVLRFVARPLADRVKRLLGKAGLLRPNLGGDDENSSQCGECAKYGQKIETRDHRSSLVRFLPVEQKPERLYSDCARD